MAKKQHKAQGERANFKLTLKQDAFCLAYVETANASEAYRRAYGAENYSERALWVKASQTLALDKVRIRVEELQQSARDKHAITVDFLTAEYRNAIALAKTTQNAAGLTGAITALGKLHGLIVEKKQVDSNNRHHHSAEPVSTFDEFLAGATGGSPEEPSSESVPD